MLLDAIKRALKAQRKYTSKNQLLDKIESRFIIGRKSLVRPLTVGGIKYDAGDPGDIPSDDLAISIVLNYNKNKSEKRQIASILQQIENDEARGAIYGGMVIYISANLDDWYDGCIAIDRNVSYKGQSISLKNQYYEDWESPYEDRETKCRYAIFMTPKTERALNA